MRFTRVLIANRGEIAVRIVRACRELGITPVVVYSEADAGALHVRLADVAYPIGPAPAAESYLRGEAVIAAALATGAEAIHPGYGFLSENATFARACAAAGLVFIGPPPQAIEAMGQKIAARRIVAQAGVPVVPGYNGDDQRDATLFAEAEHLGYPLLIKASAGGGGKGMRVVQHAAEFTAALEGARREARAAFGDDTVFLERLLDRPRHIEIQVLADAYGTVIHLGERECSIQRRHQKIVEESPSPALTSALRNEMGAAAVRAAQAVSYVNAGTVEFMLDADGHYYFLEMNTRLQVEHPVTEMVTGLDLVHLQFAIASGEPLPFTQEDLRFRGHAIEVRVYAEDPVTFLPDTGHLALCDPPSGFGVRVDTGVATGDSVTVHYDPMLAKVIAHGADRLTALKRLRRALDEYAVLGVTTNLPLLRAIVAHPAFAAGESHTGFLAAHAPALQMTAPAHLPNEVLVAATLWELTTADPCSPVADWQPRPDPFALRWRANGYGVPFQYRWREDTYRLWVHAAGDGWQIAIAHGGANDEVVYVVKQASNTTEIILSLRPQPPLRNPQSPVPAPQPLERFRVTHAVAEDAVLVLWRAMSYRLARPAPLSVDSYGHHGAGHGGAGLTAPMPGTLIKVLVSAGQQVREGQPLMVLEAMKMEHTVIAPCDGVILDLPFAEGTRVSGGVTLVELEEREIEE